MYDEFSGLNGARDCVGTGSSSLGFSLTGTDGDGINRATSGTGLPLVRLADIPQLRVLGRTPKERDPLTVFWTGSGIEMNICAGELWADVISDYGLYETWVDVIIDHELSQHFMLPKGRSTICLFRGMDPSDGKNVRLLRDSQAASEDRENLFQILGLRTDGSFLPLSEPALRLEFIGDSITTGEGCSGAPRQMEWNPASFHAYYNYARETADLLDAEYRCLSQGGWGVWCGWDGDVRHRIPRIYTQVCGLLEGERNAALGAKEPWDFTGWQPDVVVINLGTNDDGAFLQPMWRDPVTGEPNPMRRNADGSFVQEDAQKVADAVTKFLHTVREHNPEGHIIWAYGMIGRGLMPVLSRGMERYRRETGDTRAELMILPDAADLGYGSRGHPGRETHSAAAHMLARRIREL